MNIKNRTITIEELSKYNKNEFYLTTKIIAPIIGKIQVYPETMKEAIETDRSGYSIWVWLDNIPPLQLCNNDGEIL